VSGREPRDMAMRALRDCGCIRVRLGAVPRGHQLLQREGLLRSRRVRETHADIWLNDAGLAQAAQLKPWSETA